MKSRIPAVLLSLSLALVAFGAVASSASAAMTTGKIANFSYNSDAKSGVLTVVTGGDKVKFRVKNSSTCGVSYGQSGSEIPCRTLGKDKYDGRVADVRWKMINGRRITSLVSVRMY